MAVDFCSCNVLEQKGFLVKSHHVEIKVTQRHCVICLTHFLHHIIDFQTHSTGLSFYLHL